LRRRLSKSNGERPRVTPASWLAERVELGPLVAFAAKKTVPIHRHTWIYLLGGAAMFLFALQVATGALLMLYYHPTEAGAFQSVERIMTEVPFGWLVRSMHVWGADLFVGIVVLHFLTTLLSAAYRKPREMTWMAGVLLLFTALAFGFSGYLLPWNERSYFATLVGTQIPGTIPVVGETIVHLLRGGDQVTGDTITRFFAAHVMFLPIALGAALLVHLALIQGQGMSLPLGMTERDARDHQPFFTEFGLTDAGVWLVLFGLVVTLAVFLPASLGTRADPLQPAPEGIKPEWYFLFMFQMLKLIPAKVLGLEGNMLGVMFFGLVALFLFTLPLLDRAAARERRSRLLTTLLLALIAAAAALQVWALMTPGVEHAETETAAEATRTARSAVSLALLWAVILFLAVYLQKLRRENARVRRLQAERP